MAHGVVVRGGHVDELDAARAEGRHGGDDVRGQEGDVLDTCARVEGDVLFDLGLSLAGGGLVDGHLDDVVGRRHDDGAQGGELGADLRVVDRPEAVEGEALLVEGAGRDHLVPVLVADAVVDASQGDGWLGDRRGLLVVDAETGEEGTGVVVAGDEGVGGISICADDGRGDGAMLDVLGDLGSLDSNGTLFDGLVVYAFHIVDFKGYILDGIAVLLKVSMDLL